MDSLVIKDTALTVTYDACEDYPLPNNDYGETIDVSVSANMSYPVDKVGASIVINIDGKTYLPGEVRRWLILIENAEKAVGAIVNN